QCENPSDANYRDTPLTIHGLWPNKRNRPAQGQPQSCSTVPVARFSDELSKDLKKYMPGVADGLPGYEWRKHGVCSGLTPEAYFSKLVALAKAANETIGVVIKDKGFLGKPMPVNALLEAVAGKDPDLANAIVVDCQFSRQQRGNAPSRAYVGEIRVLLAKDFPDSVGDGKWPATFVNRASVGYG